MRDTASETPALPYQDATASGFSVIGLPCVHRWLDSMQATGECLVMRLSKAQTETIVTIIRQRLGCDAQVQVFGSMTNDRARGGDVDLLVSSPKRVDLTERARIGLMLEQALGLPVDLVFVEEGKPLGSFERLAAAQSEPLAHVP